MSKAKQQENNQVQLNGDELKDFMTHIIENNRVIQAKGITPITINVEGDAGIGKTSVILQLAKEKGLDMIRLNLAEIEELGDLVGFPVKEFEMIKDEVIKWVPESTIPQYIASGYKPSGERRMSHAPPEFIHGKSNGGILLLDDYTRADARFMQATMTLVETQSYMSWKLPKDWHIVLTTNPDDGNYSVTSLDAAQKTRWASVRFKFDVQVWSRWAEKEGVDSRCINFLLLHPEIVNREVNPRSIMTFFNSISSLKDFSSSIPLIQMLGEGSVGPEFATLFSQFIHGKLDKLLSPYDMLHDKNESHIVGELRTCIGRGNNFRADIASILSTRLINYTLQYAENNSIDQGIIDRLIRFCTDPDIFSDDLKYLLVKRIFNANKQKFQKMMMNVEVQKMAIK